MDDVWGDDDALDLQRESRIAQSRLFNQGFRDGRAEGCEEARQRGFEDSFPKYTAVTTILEFWRTLLNGLSIAVPPVVSSMLSDPHSITTERVNEVLESGIRGSGLFSEACQSVKGSGIVLDGVLTRLEQRVEKILSGSTTTDA